MIVHVNFYRNAIPALLLALICLMTGCEKKQPRPSGKTDKQPAGSQSPASPDKSPNEELVLITPHNENIKYEFEQAFIEHCKQTLNLDVAIQWRNVGGGSSSILQYLKNVYAQSDTAGIDILFGGGEFTFQTLQKDGLLEKLQLDDSVWQNIPATFGGMEMYNSEKTWCGNVVSSFGFLYNKDLLKQLNIPAPLKWENLGKAEFFDLIILADPTQSGSVAAANEMIVQSEKNWPDGWAKLIFIISNAKKFTDNSGSAANAPGLGEAAVSVCIDFYGSIRVSEAPEKLGYISPKGQTGFTPDPISILKNPPHPKLAQEYVKFVLSLKGQSLWALKPQSPDGPKKYSLNRPPIRKDFYTVYDTRIPEWITRPYSEGAEMMVDAQLREIRYGVLAQLVRAAAIDNLQYIHDARKKLIEKNNPADLVALFTRLPDNVSTVEQIKVIAEQLKDETQNERIITDWTVFFRNNYKKIISE